MNPIKAWLNARILWIKGFAVLAVLATICYGLWYLHHDGYEAGRNEVMAQWNAERAQLEKTHATQLAAQAERIKHAEVQHDTDQATITQFADDARRVRIHLPACPGTSKTGADPDGGSGVLQSGVDAAFARFQERVGVLFTRCDQLNIDAIRLNAAAK